MAQEFSQAVDDGLKLAKRLYFGKDRAVAPPKPVPSMDKSLPAEAAHLPASPMLYAVIQDPAIVDNPDIPSYQPHVHGRCDPPALIPLHMNRIQLEADTYLDTATVRVSGSWRVHCVMGSKSCDIRLAIPMGEQGSILGVEVEVPRKVYSSELVALGDKKDSDKEARPETGGFLRPHIFTLTVPKVDGGSTISVKVSWVQKLLYSDGEFSLIVPFSFPEYVTPSVKKLPKKETIQLNVDSGIGTEIVCKSTSHPLKVSRREAGKLCFFYESEVLTWKNVDLAISCSVSSSQIFGGVLLQSPSVHDIDQREMFCVYLFPGDQKSRKVFRKEIVFVVDISGSMQGKPLEVTKNALSDALNNLDSKDLFNVLAFNGETYLFSSSVELATEGTVERAIQWMDTNFVARGSTTILRPLTQAIEMVSNTHGSIPIVFLITDGAVEDERHICDVMKSHLTGGGSINPHVYTFGIGSYCNHYFLRLLAMISKGQYDAAYDIDSIGSRMQKLLRTAMSAVLVNVSIDTFDALDEVEVYPAHVPDLSSESPLIVSGRYQGNFPESLKARAVLGDLQDFVLDLKLQKAKDVPLDRVLAKQHIDLFTAQAWFLKNKDFKEKVTKMSLQTGIVSEYTRMVLLESERGNQITESPAVHKLSPKTNFQKVGIQEPRRILLQSFCVGFGNLTATADNIPPGVEEQKRPEATEIIRRAASNCCVKMCTQCCCMCCIRCCSKMDDQCALVLTECCMALTWLGCFECCTAICCSDSDGH